MRDEARLLGWLRHRNIVDVMDLTTINGRVAVIMEYLEAVDLKTVIQKHLDDNQWVPPRAALDLTAYVASALDAAYNRPPYQGEKPLRVIHRDIKPSNIMVDESGTVKVLDFGVARADFDMRESHTQELPFGSVDYMPPERLFFEPETPFSDTYSLGATLYEILALEKLGKAKGRPERHATFLQERMAALRARVPMSGANGDAVEALLREMLAYAHDQRPTASDVVQRCRALARSWDGDGLTEWAEIVVGPLVKVHRDAPREPNPLVDAVLTEDSAFAAAPAAVSSPDDLLARYASTEVTEPENPAPVEVSREDERWKMLSESVKAELAQAPVPAALDPSAVGVEAAPVVEKPPPPPEPEPSPGNPEDFDDVPTRVKEIEAARPPLEEATMLANKQISEEFPAVAQPKPQGRLASLPPPSRPVAPPMQAPSPAPVEEEVVEEPKPRSWLLPVLGAAFVLGLVLVAGIGGTVWYVYGRMQTPAVPSAPVVTETPSASPAAPSAPTPSASTPAPSAPAAADAPIHFIAKVENPRKMTAECDGAPFNGVDQVGVTGTPSKCVVTVVLADRSRLVAEVSPVAPGTYNCFAGGEKKCSP